MGQGFDWTRVARIARASATVACGLALAQCSSSHLGKSSYSQKVIADGEPIPKGGGSYRVGQPYSINGHTYYPSENPSYRDEGIASWYGPDFHGRLTANGEIYDMNSSGGPRSKALTTLC